MNTVKVTQADRDAAAGYWGNDNPPLELLNAFARHRIAALDEAAKVAARLKDEYHTSAVSIGRHGFALEGCKLAATQIERTILALKEKTDD